MHSVRAPGRIFIVLLLIFELISCTPSIRPYVKGSTGIEKKFERNYKIGETKETSIGQPMVKVKDYTLHRYASNIMSASEDFILKIGNGEFAGSKNANYEIFGEVIIDNKPLKCIKIKIINNNPFADAMIDSLILINEDGSVYHSSIGKNAFGKWAPIMASIKVEPPDLKFTVINKEDIDVQAGYTNYELIYSGTDGKSITITYREFTADDLARTSFFQNLVYEANANQIRFKDTIIRLQQVSNEKIVFSIISDGLTP